MNLGKFQSSTYHRGVPYARCYTFACTICDVNLRQLPEIGICFKKVYLIWIQSQPDHTHWSQTNWAIVCFTRDFVDFLGCSYGRRTPLCNRNRLRLFHTNCRLCCISCARLHIVYTIGILNRMICFTKYRYKQKPLEYTSTMNGWLLDAHRPCVQQ